MSLATVEKLRDDPRVGSIDLLPAFEQELDVSRKFVKAPAKAASGFDGPTGKNVTIGIVDADIDVFHQSLRNADGTTRFTSLWDMHPAKSAQIDNLRPPDGFKKGVVYSRADLNLAIAPPVKGNLRQGKLSGNLQMLRGRGHGTRVASIAAGNGRMANGTTGPNIGIAPDAELVGVVMREPSDWAMAMRYLRGVMKGKPAVMNLSAGEHHGPHLPGGRVERWFQAFIEKSGIPLVKSAGNGRNLAGHATGLIGKKSGVDLHLVMSPKVAALDRRLRVQIWYGYGGGDPKLSATIASPLAKTAYDIPYDGQCTGPSSLVMASNRKRPDHLGLSAIVLWLKPVPGRWTIRLTAPKDQDVTWHAWVTWSASRRGCHFEGAVTEDASITVPVAVPNMVTVASFVTKQSNGLPPTGNDIAASSASGPAADGKTAAITIAAPGEYIMSAMPPGLKEPAPGATDRYGLASGTSFAAPHVTGAIALMLEKNGKLKPDEIVEILRRDPDGSLKAKLWGAGRLDIKKLLDRVPEP